MNLADRLRSDDYQVVRKALGELGLLPAAEAVPMLEELALEPDPSSRSYALEGMAKISPERAKALALRFLEDPEWGVRTGAIYHFWETRDADAVPRISRILSSDPDEITRSWSAIYLGAAGDESAFPVLMAAIEHDTGTDHEGTPIRSIARNSIEKIRARLSSRDI